MELIYRVGNDSFFKVGGSQSLRKSAKKNKKFGPFLKLHVIFQSYLAVGLAKLGYLW